jgi:hypothetical protein
MEGKLAAAQCPQALALRDVEAALRTLDRLGVSGMGPVQLREYLRLIRRSIDRLELHSVRGMAAMEKLSAFDDGGAADVVAWVANECGMSPEAVSDRVVVARQLDQLQNTVDQATQGSLNFEKVVVVARTTAKVRPEDVAEVEEKILAEAPRLHAGLLRHHSQRVYAEVDADALRRDHAWAWAKRAFRIGPVRDGLAPVSGMVTAQCATDLRAGTEPFMCPLSKDDDRTRDQRRHDALHEMARRATGVSGGAAAGAGDGIQPRGARHDIVVVTTEATLRGEDGPPSLLDGDEPMTQEELGELLCDARLTTVVKDMRGNIIAGTRARAPSPRLSAG